MKHHSLHQLYDPHIPNNPDFAVQGALETVLQEIQDEVQYGDGGDQQERIARLEAGFMLLAARLLQNNNI